MEISLRTAAMIKERSPHIIIFARARNRGHAFELMDLGIDHIKRETIDSSIFFVGELLLEMGVSDEKVQTLINKFRTHDELMLKKQYKVRKDDKEFISIYNQGITQLAQVLSEESDQAYIEPKD